MKVIEEINRGGFGLVEKIRLNNGTIVARKTFNPLPQIRESTDVNKLLRRFSREVRVQSSLPNEYFIPVLDKDLEGDRPWFTMPLSDRNYADLVQEDRNSSNISIDALADILSSLEVLHNLGYTHRDLKPQNVLYHDGRWKLSDLGLVLPPRDETATLTASDSAWGTELYCAPEQAQDFRSVTNQADIYSFGCILHDIVDGNQRIPFQRYTSNGPLGAVIEKCTELNPNRRFKSIVDVRSMVLTILTDLAGNLSTSPKAEEWVTKLENTSDWDSSDLEDFARFLRSSTNKDDLWSVCRTIDENILQDLHDIDSNLWESVVSSYLEWSQSAFDHRYCDVIIRRLELITSIGSIDAKASAILAAAVLGTKHNSWLVMDRVLSMCGPHLSERIAQRVAIEIVVEQLTEQFRRCAHALDRTIDEYHIAIADVLRI